MNKDQLAAILSTLSVGNVVSLELSNDRFLSGTYTVSGSRIGRGRGGVLHVKLQARNGHEFELSTTKFAGFVESMTVGYGASDRDSVSRVSSQVGSTRRIPANA